MRHDLRSLGALAVCCGPLLVAGGGPGPGAAAAPARDGQGGASDQALVIIDIQNFYFEGGLVPLVGSVDAAARARAVLQHFRAARLPVIHVRHLSKTATDGEPYRIRPEVAPLASEKVITKAYANSFRETDLLETLQKLGTKRLVLCGMQTHMCVEAAARAAADLGFDVTVVADACATRDLAYGGVTVPAAHVHAAALAALQGTYATVVTTADIVGSAPVPAT
jgi:nicotinamidase-related amidase